MTGDSTNVGNSDAVTVRSATASDIPAIVAIERQAPGASHWSEAEYGRIVSFELCLVAETENQIAGFLCAKQADGDWDLENIAVASALQRCGIATDLLKILLDHIRQSGASAVFLEVRESNVPARRFYETRGFAEIGRRRKYYHLPEEDAVLYRLNIATTLGNEA